MADRAVRGLSELQRFLDDLPVKMERNILRGGLRAGMKVVQPSAKSNVRSVTGLLAAGLEVGTRVKNGRAVAYLVARGRHAFLAPWIEFGVRPHKISAKDGGWLSFGGIFAKSTKHPGIAPFGSRTTIGPRSFMRPALDARSGAAIVAMAEYIKRRLTKQGLDTSDVQIGVED